MKHPLKWEIDMEYYKERKSDKEKCRDWWWFPFFLPWKETSADVKTQYIHPEKGHQEKVVQCSGNEHADWVRLTVV